MLSAHEDHMDRRIVAQANALVESSRRVTLVSVPTRIAGASLDDAVRLIMPPGSANGRALAMKQAVRYVSAPLSNAIKTICYGLGLGPVASYRRFFRQVAPRETFDAIHCHDLQTLPAAVELKNTLAPKAKIIYDSHELFPCLVRSRGFQRYWTKVEKRHIRRADAVITVNESIADELARRYGIATPEVIYNSCHRAASETPISRRRFCEHFGAPPEGFKVMLQGNLTADRNLENLVEAFAGMDRSTQLLLLGCGGRQGHLRKLCSRRGIGNVYFGPWIRQEELLGFVAHADMGIVPYAGDDALNTQYCTPNKLFEFIEAGIPVCASDLPELRKIVAGCGIGGVYAMDSPEAIGRAIDDCRRRCQRGEFSEQALRAAREKFAWTTQKEKLLAIYEKLSL